MAGPRVEVGVGTRATGPRPLGDARGSMATEYALLLVFISVVAIIGMLVLGGGMSSLFDGVGAQGTQQVRPGEPATGPS